MLNSTAVVHISARLQNYKLSRICRGRLRQQDSYLRINCDIVVYGANCWRQKLRILQRNTSEVCVPPEPHHFNDLAFIKFSLSYRPKWMTKCVHYVCEEAIVIIVISFSWQVVIFYRSLLSSVHNENIRFRFVCSDYEMLSCHCHKSYITIIY
jgi:hypothetical protein